MHRIQRAQVVKICALLYGIIDSDFTNIYFLMLIILTLDLLQSIKYELTIIKQIKYNSNHQIKMKSYQNDFEGASARG